MKPGERFFLAYAAGVESVAFVEDGTGGRNLRRRCKDPVVVLDAEGDEIVTERASLYKDELAAAIASAEIKRKLDEEP